MRIDKWYCDCVDSEGNAAILYSGRMEAGPFAIGFSAAIETGAEASRRSCWREGRVVRGRHLRIRIPRLHAQGAWHAGKAIARAVLWQSAEGCIAWECVQPQGTASLDCAGRHYSGWGYAERLEMTLPPWRLPFSCLRWGRFIADGGNTSAVWIEWADGADRRWCWVDGEPAELLGAGRDSVRTSAGALRLFAHRTISCRTLSDWLPAGLRAAGRLLPRFLRCGRETKWLSRASMRRTRGAAAEGWAIHEVVRWG